MKQTGVECTLYGARLVLDSALPLQPFLEAFGDTGAFEVLFLVQRQPGFRGLRRFESEGVTVLLTQDGSPYRYRFTVEPDKAAGVSLPLYAPPEPRPQTPRAEASRRSGGLWHLLVYGLGAGGAVFVTMLARGRIRAARASQT
ncbi:MAG: hypothetical protein GX446_02320 [Chthonomonadales bacterium]|nr:hypothetical protein [Chthonomonadales bacterium]